MNKTLMTVVFGGSFIAVGCDDDKMKNDAIGSAKSKVLERLDDPESSFSGIKFVNLHAEKSLHSVSILSVER